MNWCVGGFDVVNEFCKVGYFGSKVDFVKYCYILILIVCNNRKFRYWVWLLYVCCFDYLSE